jgi:hypothetical protein
VGSCGGSRAEDDDDAAFKLFAVNGATRDEDEEDFIGVE